MTKDNVLFSLVGVGFGLFFGFAFVTWANQRAQPSPRAAAQSSESDANSAQAEADAAVKRARENPKDFDAQMEGARAYYDARRFDEAVDLLLRANELQPTNVEPVVALAHVNADARNYKAAEKWYVAALGMKPDDADARASLGRVLLLAQQPDYKRAAAEFRRALETDPRHEPSLQFLAFALAQSGDERGAREAVARLEKIDPNNAALPRLREEIEARARSPQPAGARDRNANSRQGGAR
ncbi:MAG: tetratricopeptide repeat protein [Acidobacteria bacterium]|nr:tetratricopeptide repeat protein [Acidobacteriota bacterium]MCA1642507.1 tetratricopeptide repeat protein [Acidobacteriota bacterium]